MMPFAVVMIIVGEAIHFCLRIGINDFMNRSTKSPVIRWINSLSNQNSPRRIVHPKLLAYGVIKHMFCVCVL